MKREIINNTGLTNRVGVISCSSLEDWIYDEINDVYGIDITYESYLEDLRLEATEQATKMDLSEDDTEDFVENYIEENSDNYYSDNHTVLFGDWIKNSKGKYEINKNGKYGFAAEFSSGSFGDIVVVEYSKFATRCNKTSPCFVMSDGSGPCGDLNSEGDLLTQCLPEEYYRIEE